jgi:hypothetical protein
MLLPARWLRVALMQAYSQPLHVFASEGGSFTLSYDSEFDEEDEELQRFQPMKMKVKRKPPRKTSYEGHTEVQR